MTMVSTQTYNAGDVLTANSLTKHVAEAYPTVLGAALNASGFDITAIDELAFADAAASATVGGRVRRNGANLEWHNGTASGRLFFAGGTDVPVADGGTGLSSGTSGGVPYFSGATTMASSDALAASRLVLGGGAGTAPSTLGSLGTTTTVLHGNAAGAPSYGAVALGADVSGELPLANGGTAANLSDPGADRILFWDESSNAITWLTVGSGLTITDTTIAGGAESGTWSSPVRAIDTIYQNTSGKKRRVMFSARCDDGDQMQVLVGSSNPPTLAGPTVYLDTGVGTDLIDGGVTFEVPNNWYYKADIAAGAPTLPHSWLELDE